MPFRSIPRAFTVLVLMAGLSGCAVAELAAHGVKEWDKRNQGGQQTASQSAQPQVQSRTEEEPPPPARAPASPSGRSSVTVEELPAR